MLFSEIISNVRDELLEVNPAFWTDAELLRYGNRGEKDFVNKTRTIERDAFMSLTQGRRDYPLPADWFSAQAIFFKNTEGKWRRIFSTDLEKVAQEASNFLSDTVSDQADPRKYFIRSGRIWFRETPKADGDSNVYLFYDGKSPGIATTDSNINMPEELSEALTSYILWKAWSKEKETGLAREQKELYQSYILEGRRWKKKRTGDRKYRIDIESQIEFTSGAGLSGFNPLSD